MEGSRKDTLGYDWEEFATADGYVYYVKLSSGASSWVHPSQLAAEATTTKESGPLKVDGGVGDETRDGKLQMGERQEGEQKHDGDNGDDRGNGGNGGNGESKDENEGKHSGKLKAGDDVSNASDALKSGAPRILTLEVKAAM